MLHFEGNKDLPPPPAEVWGKLTDPRFLVQCLPGVETVAAVGPERVVCTLRPGFAFVRGTLELTLQLADLVPEQSGRLLLHARGIGSSSDAEAALTLAPQGSGTRLYWAVDIKSLGGLLKAVPQGLLKASAQKVLAEALAAVEARLR